MQLSGKVAVITGAGAGLGRAVTLRFLAEGAQVVAVSLYEHELNEVRRAAGEHAASMTAVVGDVADAASAEAVARQVRDKFGHVDVLFNNAGIIIVKPIEETTVEEWDRLMAINLRGPFLYCRAFVPMMKAQRDGVILNMSSGSGIKGFVGESGYCPSKHGIEGLTKTLALELEPYNIRVMSITPGVLINTPMSEMHYTEEQRKVWQDPAIIAPAFVYLAQERNPAFSGQRLNAYEISQKVERGEPVGP
jgi:NAD(P)-dependent dehydrogenase (short-subunit alcohol dehydrogenase family)